MQVQSKHEPGNSASEATEGTGPSDRVLFPPKVAGYRDLGRRIAALGWRC
jgi:hypothetical protein